MIQMICSRQASSLKQQCKAWAVLVVVVFWSPCFLYSLTIEVRIPLKSAIFKNCSERTKINEREADVNLERRTFYSTKVLQTE